MTPHATDLLKALTAMLARPRQHFEKTKLVGACVKCGSHERLHKHHITYKPPNIVILCKLCHSRITGLNTKGSLVAGGNKYKRVEYTNRLRMVLWSWFIRTPWPNKRRLSRTEVRGILFKAKFNIEPRSVVQSSRQRYYKDTSDLAEKHSTPRLSCF